MTVKQMIDALMDCRSDVEVVTTLFDNGTQLTKVEGVVNQGNFVVLFEKFAWDSKKVTN